jgi:hypothetical protein
MQRTSHNVIIQTHRFPRRALRVPLHIQLLAVYPCVPAIQIHRALLPRYKGPRTHPSRMRRCQDPGAHTRE